LCSSVILVLRSDCDGGVALRASPKSAYEEKPMQVPQGIRRDLGYPQRHAGTNTGVEHPGRQYRYNTRLNLEVDHATASALFTALRADAPAVKGMPGIVDFNFLPDMGRMTA
jgi:hypothetical protein